MGTEWVFFVVVVVFSSSLNDSEGETGERPPYLPAVLLLFVLEMRKHLAASHLGVQTALMG